MQSDSTPDPGTTPDNRSLADLYRDLGVTHDAWLHGGCTAGAWSAYENARGRFWQRMDTLADRHDTNQAIREHAQVEHSHLSRDAQAAVFTTGRFVGDNHTHDAIVGDDHTPWKADRGEAADEGWAR